MKLFYDDTKVTEIDPCAVHSTIEEFFGEGEKMTHQQREDFIQYTLEYMSAGAVKSTVNFTDVLDAFISENFVGSYGY